MVNANVPCLAILQVIVSTNTTAHSLETASACQVTSQIVSEQRARTHTITTIHHTSLIVARYGPGRILAGNHISASAKKKKLSHRTESKWQSIPNLIKLSNPCRLIGMVMERPTKTSCYVYDYWSLRWPWSRGPALRCLVGAALSSNSLPYGIESRDGSSRPHRWKRMNAGFFLRCFRFERREYTSCRPVTATVTTLNVR